MKRLSASGLVVAILATAPALAAVSSGDPGPIHRYRHPHHHAHKPVEPEAVAPKASPPVAPSPWGESDPDGLSRNQDDCNKGCIGGNPD
jgi:hypothetical protein